MLENGDFVTAATLGLKRTGVSPLNRRPAMNRQGSPPAKRRKLNPITKSGQKWFCVFCNQNMPIEDQKAHMNSLAHAKKKRKHLSDQASGETYECTVCKKWVKIKNRTEHQKSRKHLKKLSQAKRSGDEMVTPPGLDGPTPAPLPAGWTQHFHPASSKTYYYHAASKHTTWNHPLSDEYQQEYEKHLCQTNPEYAKLMEEKNKALQQKFTDPSYINAYRAAGAEKFEAFCDIISSKRTGK